MWQAVSEAFVQIFSPAFRGVMLRALTMTLAMLALLWAGLYALFTHFVVTSWPLTDFAFGIFAGFGLLIGLTFLIAPVTSLFAGLFLDDVAGAVERLHYPTDPPGRPMPLIPGLFSALRFTALVIGVNLLVLLLLIVPGINLFIFFIANAYLLGREYFTFVAERFHPRETASAIRRAAALPVFAAGVAIAVFLAVPILNLFTPLFATALMVHVYKRIERQALGPRFS